MSDDNYQFEISYPTDTVLYEIYCCCKGNNAKEIRNAINERKYFDSYSKLQNVMCYEDIRLELHRTAYSNRYATRDSFSYVEIPLKEE